MMTIDDFVMLGTTVPEPKSDGRVFVCSAGYSATLRSLVRIYPLARAGAPTRWSVSTVKLERNPQDHRAESFKLAGDRTPEAHRSINSLFRIDGMSPKAGRAQLLKKCSIGSIAEANDRSNYRSLAIIHARNMELEFEHNPSSPESPQLALFPLDGEEPQGARRFPFIPRLHFDDEQGHHRLMLRDWGVYELMRKNNNLALITESERRKYVGKALHLGPTCSLLVGNLNNQRNAWLVISVLHGLREAPSLLDALVGVA
jgi:hypothetical protein